MLEDPKEKSLHQDFIKHFGKRIDIDYLDTEEVVKFFLQASDQYDKKIIQDRLDRYNATQR
jgi:hypothetical protein